MKQFLKDKAIILILIGLMISIFALGNVYFKSVLYVEPETSTEATTTIDITIDYDSVSNVVIAYHLDLETLGEKSYLVAFDYESISYQAYLDNNFQFVEMVVGTYPNEEVMALVREHILDGDDLIDHDAYFVSYDSSTRTIVMETKGFVSNLRIQVSIVLNEDLNAISSFSVVSPENYDSEYNQNYTGGAVPEVENTMISDYLQDGLPVDAVAGASRGTGVGMQKLITLLDLLMQSLQGGN